MSNHDYTWRNRSWTPDRVETLKRMWADGATAEAIAQSLHQNCSEKAVWSKARSLGLAERDDGTSKFWNKTRIKRLTALWDEGHSAGVIAEELGTTRNAIIGKVHRLKLPKRGEEGKRIESRRANRGRRTLFNRPTAAQRYGQGQTAHIAPHTAKRLAPLPMPPPDVKPPSAVKFEALEPHHCRWVYGDAADRAFCGCKTVSGSSWCANHFARVFRPIDIEPVRRRDIPQRQKTFDEIERENA